MIKAEKDCKALDAVAMGRRIRTQREFLRLTRDDLSYYCSISPEFICSVESGKKGVSIGTLYCLAQALDISADYLLGGPGGDDMSEEERQDFHCDIVKCLDECSGEQLKGVARIAKFLGSGIRRE